MLVIPVDEDGVDWKAKYYELATQSPTSREVLHITEGVVRAGVHMAEATGVSDAAVWKEKYETSHAEMQAMCEKVEAFTSNLQETVSSAAEWHARTDRLEAEAVESRAKIAELVGLLETEREGSAEAQKELKKWIKLNREVDQHTAAGGSIPDSGLGSLASFDGEGEVPASPNTAAAVALGDEICLGAAKLAVAQLDLGPAATPVAPVDPDFAEMQALMDAGRGQAAPSVAQADVEALLSGGAGGLGALVSVVFEKEGSLGINLCAGGASGASGKSLSVSGRLLIASLYPQSPTETLVSEVAERRFCSDGQLCGDSNGARYSAGYTGGSSGAQAGVGHHDGRCDIDGRCVLPPSFFAF